MPVTTYSTVNKGQTSYVTLEFIDEDGVAITPSSISYNIYDVISGTEILTATAVTSPASSITIEITPAQNTIINDNEDTELHVLTAVATYETTRQTTGQEFFYVKNLKFLPEE